MPNRAKATLSGADFLIWAFHTKLNFVTNARLTQEEVEQRFGPAWDIVRAWGGEQPDRFPARWYHLRRR